MQDITPLPIARADNSPENSYGSVPVKKPTASVSLTQQVDNPISTDARTLAQFASEAEMDKILDDINKKVQAGNTQQSDKKGIFSFLKRPEKKPTTPQTQSAAKTEAPKPTSTSSNKRKFTPVVVVAVIVAVGLSALAFTAFTKQNTQPVINQNQPAPTSSQSNSSVTTEEIDKLSSDINSQAKSLSAGEDFSPDELSDSVLGL